MPAKSQKVLAVLTAIRVVFKPKRERQAARLVQPGSTVSRQDRRTRKAQPARIAEQASTQAQRVWVQRVDATTVHQVGILLQLGAPTATVQSVVQESSARVPAKSPKMLDVLRAIRVVFKTNRE